MMLSDIAAVVGDATAASGLDVLSPIVSTGVVGSVLLMILFRWKLMPTWVADERDKGHARELAAKDAEIAELRATVKEMSQVYTEQVIPTLVRTYDLLAERQKVADG